MSATKSNLQVNDEARRMYVLAFDVEHTGIETIAIGAAVMSYDKSNPAASAKVEDSMMECAYKPEEVPDPGYCTRFEKRCKEEFWDKHLELLEHYEAPPMTVDLMTQDREFWMIARFYQFVSGWEKKVGAEELIRVTDNKAFDVPLINKLIENNLSADLPQLPHTFTTNKYGSLWETHSVQKGLLLGSELSKDASWELTEKVAKEYGVPPCPGDVKHDHNCRNDAITIAYEWVAAQEVAVRKRKAVEDLIVGLIAHTEHPTEVFLDRLDVLHPGFSRVFKKRREGEWV